MAVGPRKASIHLETLAGNDNNIMKIVDKSSSEKSCNEFKYQNNKKQT
ncbi:17729_t:CDS:1, partial [Racocetra persica]